MKNKVISLWSPVAGTGVTFTAINLARELSSKNSKVALLDFDLKTPSLAIYLQIEDMMHCLDNVLPFFAGDNNNPAVLESNMHKIENFYVLTGTNLPEQAHYMAVETLSKIVDMVREIFDYVVIDTYSIIDNAGTYVALQKADVVLFLVDKNVMMVKHYNQVRNIIENLQKDKFSLVVNKSDKKIYIDTQTIEGYLGFENALELPMLDIELVNAFNQGRWLNYMNGKQAMVYREAMRNLIVNKIDDSFLASDNRKKPIFSFLKK